MIRVCLWALLLVMLAACASREVLLPKSAVVPQGVNFSGQWLLRETDGVTRPRARERLVHVFLFQLPGEILVAGRADEAESSAVSLVLAQFAGSSRSFVLVKGARSASERSRLIVYPAGSATPTSSKHWIRMVPSSWIAIDLSRVVPSCGVASSC